MALTDIYTILNSTAKWPAELGNLSEDDEAGIAPTSSRGDATELRIDIDRVLAMLSPRQRQLCLLLKQGTVPVSALGPWLELSRSGLYLEIVRIRRVLRESGIWEYLQG